MRKQKIRCLILLAVILLVLPVNARAIQLGVDKGGINIVKTNAKGEPLEGAVFRLARAATQEEIENPVLLKDRLKIGEEKIWVIYEWFYADRNMSGKIYTEVSTDSAGQTSMYGLSHGTYYLIEEKAPDGYNRIATPIRVSVNKYSHLTAADQFRDDTGTVIDNTIHIINVRYQMPETGNSLKIQILTAGMGVVFSAAALLLLNRRRYFW